MWTEHLGFVSEAALALGVGPVAADHFLDSPLSRGLAETSLDGPRMGSLRIGDGLGRVVPNALEPFGCRRRSVRPRSRWRADVRRGGVEHRLLAHLPALISATISRM